MWHRPRKFRSSFILLFYPTKQQTQKSLSLSRFLAGISFSATYLQKTHATPMRVRERGEIETDRRERGSPAVSRFPFPPNIHTRHDLRRHAPAPKRHLFTSKSFDHAHHVRLTAAGISLHQLSGFCAGLSYRRSLNKASLLQNTTSTFHANGCSTTMSGGPANGQEVAVQMTTSEGAECEHLLVLVHGILSSPSDWKYVMSQLKKRLSSKFLIYASAANSYAQTLSGIDVAGRRLAEEVQQVILKNPSLKQISFLGHSLGGLFARYAIGILYDWHKDDTTDSSNLWSSDALKRNKIGGLLPINFITLATPHLGVRGKRQLPFLLGLAFLEKLAAPIAPFLAGRTGRQLFLMDEKPSKPPLLLQMASDTEDIPFLSSLSCFKVRTCYANVSYDHMVGWRTSSIRRETELPVPPRESMNGYKHVVSVTYSPPVHMEMPSFHQESAGAKEAAQTAPKGKMAMAYYYDQMEEEMIRGLQQVAWVKVDVSFHEALWPFLAHDHIHVKSQWLHFEGAGVVAHVADSFKQENSRGFIMANL